MYAMQIIPLTTDNVNIALGALYVEMTQTKDVYP